MSNDVVDQVRLVSHALEEQVEIGSATIQFHVQLGQIRLKKKKKSLVNPKPATTREQVTYLHDAQKFLALLRFDTLDLEVDCSCLVFLYGCLQFQVEGHDVRRSRSHRGRFRLSGLGFRVQLVELTGSQRKRKRKNMVSTSIASNKKNRNGRLKLENKFSELLDCAFIVDTCLFETFDFTEMFSNLSLLPLCWMKENETAYYWQILKFDTPRSSFSCFSVFM